MPLPSARLHPVRLALANGALQGQVAVREAADGTLWLVEAAPGKDPKALHFGLRVPVFLRWASLRASTDAPVRVALLTAKGLAPWGEAMAAEDAAFLARADRDAALAELAARVHAFVDYRDGVLAGARRYSPATSWAAANAADDEDEAIVAAWAGSDFSTGERDHAPGYAALLGRDWPLHAGSEALRAFRDDARALAAALPTDPGRASAASVTDGDGGDE
jgi:exodeoxyribonuclease V gamma subunit